MATELASRANAVGYGNFRSPALDRKQGNGGQQRNGNREGDKGVYGGFIDKFPMGSLMNRSITIKTGQCHVQRYMRPLLERVQRGEIDLSFVVTHRLRLDDAPQGYETFLHKEDECVKVVLKP